VFLSSASSADNSVIWRNTHTQYLMSMPHGLAYLRSQCTTHTPSKGYLWSPRVISSAYFSYHRRSQTLNKGGLFELITWHSFWWMKTVWQSYTTPAANAVSQNAVHRRKAPGDSPCSPVDHCSVSVRSSLSQSSPACPSDAGSPPRREHTVQAQI
jgi:hypothetical protein